MLHSPFPSNLATHLFLKPGIILFSPWLNDAQNVAQRGWAEYFGLFVSTSQ